jgi:hypothetical protein
MAGSRWKASAMPPSFSEIAPSDTPAPGVV